jgi:hypothetical protein
MVGLHWTSDQSVAEASTYTEHHIKTQETNIHSPSGIRTRGPSNQAAEDLHLRPAQLLESAALQMPQLNNEVKNSCVVTYLPNCRL